MKLRINEPCNQKWSEMTPENNGMFCSQCSKTIIDFTKMTDFELINYFKQNSNVCGRFYDFQLNREIQTFKTHKNWFGIFAKTFSFGLIFSHFFDTKSQSIEFQNVKDSTEFNQLKSTQKKHKIIELILDNPKESYNKIVRLKVKVDNFKLDTIVKDETYFKIHIPDSILWSEIKIEVFEPVLESTILTIKYEDFSKIPNPQIRLFYYMNWNVLIEKKYIQEENFEDKYIILGMPSE